MTTKPKVTPIKASLAFAQLVAANLYTFGCSIYAGMNNNPAYPQPPVEMPALKSTLDGFNTLITAALDGSKKVLAERNHQGEVLIKILKHLARYVETVCKDDMTTFLSSGFQAVSKVHTVTPPMSQSIRKITEGLNRGQLFVWLVKVAGALSYEVRWLPVATATTASATAPAWASTLVASTQPPAIASNLTPGTNYQFEVRVLGKTGWSDWGGAVTRFAI
jgi:hypothetical protein